MADSSNVRSVWPFTVAFLTVISLVVGRTSHAEPFIVNGESTTDGDHLSSSSTAFSRWRRLSMTQSQVGSFSCRGRLG